MGFKDMLNLVASSESDEGGEAPKAEKKQEVAMSAKARAFLDKIEQLESSGGKNTNHKPVKGGLNEGDSAVGRYGVMPKTAADAVRIHKSKGLGDLQGLSPEDLAKKMREDPSVEDRIAGTHADYLLNKYGNEEAAARAWRMGTYDPKNRDPKEVDRHPYVKAFKKLSSKHDKRIGKIVENDEPTDADEEI